MRTIKSSKIDAPRGVTDGLAQKMRRRRVTLQQIHESELHAPPRRNDLAPDLKFERIPLNALKPADRRVRRSEPAQVQRVMASLSRYGQCVPIVTRKRKIVHGHTVFEAAGKIGMSELFTVDVAHLSPSEARTLAVTLNRLGERGSWDLDALQLEFQELVALDEDLDVIGFETAEIDMILSSELEEIAEEETRAVPALSANPTSRPGDVWISGNHRLIQGDARDANCYPRLLGTRFARLLLTDMPYNLPMRSITSNERHAEFACGGGELDRPGLVHLTADWIRAAMPHVVKGGLISTAIDWRSIDVVMEAARELGLTHINTCVWSKTNAGQGSPWRSAHELYPFFRNGSEALVDNVQRGVHGRWRSNIWVYPGASSIGSDSRKGLALHPTVKPRALIEDVLLDVTHRGDVVIDCFAGSGTTLVAAEATGRVCVAIEIDGGYCDVSVKRWQQMTKREAVLEETGETFAAVGERRAQSGASE